MNFDKLVTEQVNPESLNLDTMSTLDAAKLMNAMDAQVAQAVEKALPQVAQAVDVIAEHFRRGGRLLYCGAGTSGRLGVLDASECPPTFGVAPEMVVGIMAGGDRAIRFPIEGAEDKPELGAQDMDDHEVGPDDVVVGISASGYAPYCVGAIDRAKEKGAYTLAVVCTPDSNMSKHADLTIAAVVGPEVLSGSTRLRAGTATKMVLNMLTTLSMVRIGKVYKNFMVDMTPTNAKLRDRAVRMVQKALSVDRETAAAALTAADGSTKVALVAHEAGVDPQQARAALEANEWFVRKAIASLK